MRAIPVGLAVLVALSVPATTAGQSPSPAALEVPTPPASSTFGDGVFVVGVDVSSGTYRSSGGDCYWARLSGFGGEVSDVIANANVEGPTVVTIDPSDVGFQSQGCGTWSLLNAPATGAPVASPSPVTDSALHGEELAYDEMSQTGTLGMSLAEFVRRWNAKTGTPEFRIRRTPRITTNDNGARIFSASFTPKGHLFVLLGAMKSDEVSRVAVIWRPAEGGKMKHVLDVLMALLAFTALINAANPALPAREITVSDVGWPDPPGEGEAVSPHPMAGFERQATFEGVTYTLVGYLDEDDGRETVWLTARQADDAA